MKCFVIILKDNEISEKFGGMALKTGKEQGWAVERYDAVDGRKINLSELSKYNLTLDTRKKKQIAAMSRPGVFGNFITHWQLWMKCVELNEPIGVFEHDVLFVKPPEIDFNQFPDCLRLGWLVKQKDYGTGDCWSGAHGYIIKPKGAKKIIKWGRRNGVICADAIMGTLVLDMAFDHTQKIILNPETIVDGNPQLPKFSLSRESTF
jgi:GR25 family glycosyltransferase involved in LPS biosynthesis